MNTYLALARREIIEHRNGMIYAPAIIMGLILLLVLGALSSSWGEINIPGAQDITSVGDLIDKLADAEPLVKAGIVVGFLATLTLPAMMLLPVVIFFILLGGLYEERRDRSFLFWKSMPVSDLQEVLAKFAAAIILTPLIFWLFSILAHAIALVALSIIGGAQGGAVGALWQVSAILAGWITSPIYLLSWMLWAAPVFAWVLFCSSYAPRAPLMYAILPPAVLAVLEAILFDSAHFARWIGTHLSARPMFEGVGSAVGPAPAVVLNEEHEFEQIMAQLAQPDLTGLAGSFASLDLWAGLAITAAFLYGAVWMRRYNI